MSRHKKYDQEYKDMILELYKSGMKVSEISREYEIAGSTINGWIKKGRYGSPKIHFLMKKQGYEISEKRVQRFMREMNLYSITVKK